MSGGTQSKYTTQIELCSLLKRGGQQDWKQLQLSYSTIY